MATVAASNAERVVRFGVSRGLSPERANALVPKSTRIAHERMAGIWDELGKTLGSPDLGIALAMRSKLEDLGVLGFAVMTAPRADAALATFVRFSTLLSDAQRWEVTSDRRSVEVRLFMARAHTLGERLSQETAIAQLVGAIRQLCGADVDPERIELAHEDRPTRTHRDWLRCPMGHGARFHRVVFARSVFEATPPSANEALHRYLCGRAESEASALAPRPLATRVAIEIARLLAIGEEPRLPAVAATLGTTPRSLRRALERSGASFRTIADDARRDRARELLASEHIDVTRAAFECGFADASAFTHACRRWFGKSPSELRALLDQGEISEARCAS